MSGEGQRIAALDLIRGVAVLGILAINITSFAGTPATLYSPDLPRPGSPADRWTWWVLFILVEGKMRALFSLLFGASLVLFIDRADQRGDDGQGLQLRRLGWLALFGYLHYLLLWDGDILFIYAVAGLAAVFLRRAEPLALAASALFLCTIWQGWGLAQWQGALTREVRVAAAMASPAEVESHARVIARYREQDAADLDRIRGSGAELIAYKALSDPLRPVRIAFYSLGETLSLILLGMALFRSGFFSGAWRRNALGVLALLGTGLGGLATAGVGLWASGLGFPEVLMHFLLSYGLTFPHFAMALGYAAVLMLAANRLLDSTPGQWLRSAGQLALSNYLGTSLVMCALFYGWGLGLAGSLGLAKLGGITVLAMLLMAAASTWWLPRFGQGPIERLWRRLTQAGNG